MLRGPASPRRLRRARCPSRHYRHPAGGPRRRLRLRRRADTGPGPAGPGRRPPRGRRRPGSPDPPLPRLDLHRPLSLRARPPRQLLASPARLDSDAGDTAPARRLRNRRLHRRVPGRAAVGAGPGVRDVRRPFGAGEAATAAAASARPPRWWTTRSPEKPARRPSSSGSTSTTPTLPTRRRLRSASASRAGPTTAKWPTPTPSSDGCSHRSTSRDGAPTPWRS